VSPPTEPTQPLAQQRDLDLGRSGVTLVDAFQTDLGSRNRSEATTVECQGGGGVRSVPRSDAFLPAHGLSPQRQDVSVVDEAIAGRVRDWE
jgi:hypothetical protein